MSICQYIFCHCLRDSDNDKDRVELMKTGTVFESLHNVSSLSLSFPPSLSFFFVSFSLYCTLHSRTSIAHGEYTQLPLFVFACSRIYSRLYTLVSLFTTFISQSCQAAFAFSTLFAPTFVSSPRGNRCFADFWAVHSASSTRSLPPLLLSRVRALRSYARELFHPFYLQFGGLHHFLSFSLSFSRSDRLDEADARIHVISNKSFGPARIEVR